VMNTETYKTRLVAKGSIKKEGFDYDETHAPIARLTTVRILLSIIMSIIINENLYLDQLDVKNTFLHGTFTRDIY